jgi:hypothetical protein
MKKLSVGLVMTISLVASPAWATVHGGGNPKPSGSIAVARKASALGWTNGIAVRVPNGSSVLSRWI